MASYLHYKRNKRIEKGQIRLYDTKLKTLAEVPLTFYFDYQDASSHKVTQNMFIDTTIDVDIIFIITNQKLEYTNRSEITFESGTKWRITETKELHKKDKEKANFWRVRIAAREYLLKLTEVK